MSSTRRRRPFEDASDAAEPADNRVTDDTDVSAWIAEARGAELARWQRRKDFLARDNAERQRARDYGLKARQAARLAHRRRGVPPSP